MSFEEPGLVLEGTARDLRTGGEGPGGATRAEVAAEGAVRAGMEGWHRNLLFLHLSPARPGVEERLRGARVGSGFRSLVRSVVPGEQGTPLGLLLDDLPGAALISGYVHLRADAHAGRPAGASTPPEALDRLADICSGWRRDGRAMSSVAQGSGIPVQDCPPAPDLDGGTRDALAWQPIAPLAIGTMRRRRRIDVSGGETVAVDAMFRDSYGEPDGTEVVLHEYTLTASLDGETLEITGIEAAPRVLPFWECPLAADHVPNLVGARVGELRRVVPERLQGTSSCTHLNDLLRVLSDVPTLVARLPGRADTL